MLRKQMISITSIMIKSLLLVILLPIVSIAQDPNSNLDETTYDFWLGKWDATWINADGTTGKGINHIFKVLDGKVLEENFEITEGGQAGFKGKSLSVYNPNTKLWNQGWADNQGGYFDFYGDTEGERKMFSTNPKEKNGNIIQQRMVFYDIKNDSFTWDWEGTKDGGETWNLLWRINYTRQK